MSEAEKLLRSFVNDIEAMQRSGQYWFGPFADSTDEGLIYWPNLGILSDKARELLMQPSNEAALRDALSEAWEIAADHRKPTFETLNRWREVLKLTGKEV